MSNHSAGGGSVMEVLDRVIGLPVSSGGTASNDGADAVMARFIPSKKYAGSKPGYVFTSSDLGTGYYLDKQQQQQQRQTDKGSRRDAKRPRFEEEDQQQQQQQQQQQRSVRFDASRDTTKLIPKLTGSELLAQAEEQQSQQPTPIKTIHDLSSRGIQSSSTSFIKTLTKNQLLRAQHSDNPEKFMMNELALHDEIQQFNSVAVNMRSYQYIVEFGVMDGLLTCLNHENSDVAMSVVSVLVELMDPFLLQEQETGGERDEEEEIVTSTERMQNMNILVTAFVKGAGLDLITSNLGRFDESVEDDAKGVENVLTLMESLLDLDRAGVLQLNSAETEEEENISSMEKTKPSLSIVSRICHQTTFLSWLCQRIEKSNYGDEKSDEISPITISPAVIKLHSSELLSAILQHEDYSGEKNGLCKLSSLPRYSSAFDDDDDDDPDSKPAAASTEGHNEKKQGTIDGMETLLLAIATYRKHDPQVEVECEFLENVFDALAASLLREDNVADFVEAEGIELMLRCLRQKVHAGGGALKALNFALSGSSSSSSNVFRTACEKFVSAGGLKVIFPLYMSRKSAIPCPAACSEGGTDLSKKGGKSGGSTSSKRAKRAAQARKRWLVEIEQNAINVMYALTRHIGQDSKYDAHARLLVKFVEEECEKCDRTIELCLKYDEKARIAEYQYFRSDAAEEAEQMGLDIELAALDAKLRGGGDLFHRTCAILSFACVCSKRCHKHVRDQLRMKGSGITVIKEGLSEFATLLADGDQKSQIERFIAEI
ncbi:hypothetical protein ACHAXM_007787 [Skeletonema potamos]